MNITVCTILTSGPLTPDPPGELNIFGHDGDSLGMDGAQVGVLEQSHQVGLASLLQSHHSRALEPEISLEILSNLPHEALEWQLADQQLCRFLVPPDLSEGHSSWSVPVGFLNSSCGWGRLAGSLGSELLAGSLASGRLTSSLLGAGHFFLKCWN